MKDVFSIR